MLKKIIFLTTICAVLASNHAYAQGLGNVAIQNTALQLEVGRNSPVLAVIPAKAQVELLDFAIDNSENRCKERQHYLSENLYIKIAYNGLQGFVPAYYLSEGEGLNQLKNKAFPNKPQPITAQEKDKGQNSKPSGKDKNRGKKTN